MRKKSYVFFILVLIIVAFFTNRHVNASNVINVYYSVGQNTSNHSSGGNVSIVTGIATFTVAQTQSNLGVGDRLTAGGNIYYLASKIDTTHWNVVDKLGATPADLSSTSVTSIAHEFTSLSQAITNSKDASHLNSSNLVSSNVLLNIPCYYDNGPDITTVSVSGYTTSVDNFIKIYTPSNISTEVNQSQRNHGVWDDSKYKLEVTDANGIVVSSSYTVIDGLQLKMTITTNDKTAIALSGATQGATVSNSILRGDMHAVTSGSTAISAWYASSSAAILKVFNNIIYDFAYNSKGNGIIINSGTMYAFNNTVYNCNNNFNSNASLGGGNFVLINNISAFGGYDFNGAFSSFSSNNISTGTFPPGNNSKIFTNLTFKDIANRDLHLPATFSGARDQGIDLSANPNLSFNNDIEGNSRPFGSAWDIGADEEINYVQTDFTAPSITAFKMPTTANYTTVDVTSFTSNDPESLFAITESSDQPTQGSRIWQSTAPTKFTFGGVGTRTAYAWVMDSAGNISQSVTQTIAISLTSQSVQPNFFGHNFNNITNWPSVPFGGVRLWDAGTYWSQIELSRGQYNWTALDAWLAEANQYGVDVTYTFGITPQWASLRPTESCARGNVGCAAPASDVDSGDTIWKEFVTALVQHSLNSPTGHIKYYELWNEPNLAEFWTGSSAQMAVMANDAYTIIHSLDPNAVVLSPSATHDPSTWLAGYFAAGGTNAQDGIAFHPYPSPSAADPETLLPWVDNIRSTMQTYGIANKPIWGTESSWGFSGGPAITDPDLQTAWMAKEYILLLSKGLQRNYWYSWDNAGWGPMWDRINGVHKVGTAYGILYNWLVGSTPDSTFCNKDADNTWSCNLVLRDGRSAKIMWNSISNKTISVDYKFTNYLTLDNENNNSITANTVTIGNKPIMLTGNKVFLLLDFENLFSKWQKKVLSDATDINTDNIVNSKDLGIMMSNWN